jgi:SSS family solute:Na+ symporter
MNILASTVDVWTMVSVVVYLLIVVYLGWLGFKRTKTAADYMVAGREAHPLIMALSYGATFISTSAIVGFGGVAGLFGMSLLWLTMLNIFMGIFIAFVFIGGPTRRMGHRLDAHTFPELLGRRFDSKFIQVFAGGTIFLFMPLYAAAVLIGGTKYFATQLGVDYNAGLFIFSVITATYVLMGGLKGVMYTDALQGGIMFVGMAILMVWTYVKVGGVVPSHQYLTDMAPLVPSKLAAIGHQGWTAMPKFGWGGPQYNLWWTVVTTIVMGVGIGVLAQPQLALRFMTVKSKRELNRAVPTGGIFILAMTGVAFTVGALSNVYFNQHGDPLTGRVIKSINEAKGFAVLQIVKKDETGAWVDVVDAKGEGKKAPVTLTKDAALGIKVIDNKEFPIVQGRSISVVYAGGDAEQIIPTYITKAMPKWFGIVFLLTLLSAAMSTLSSQFHALGTGIGRDVYEQITGKHNNTMFVVRIGIIIGFVIAMLWSYYSAQSSIIIARATAIFFGLCASAFMPTFFGGLFFKRMTKAAAISSMIVGFAITTCWLLLVKAQEAGALGLVEKLTNGKDSLLAGKANWPVVDQLIVALPVSILVAIVVSLFTQPPSKEHLHKCFGEK